MRPYAAWAICCAAVAALAQMATGRGTGPKAQQGDEVDAATAALFDPTPPPLNAQEVWNYAITGCPDCDIADRFLVDESRVAREYVDTLRSARALRRYSIRKHQTLVAFSGKSSSSMLQWLGKNELGQGPSAGNKGQPEPDIFDPALIDDGS